MEFKVKFNNDSSNNCYSEQDELELKKLISKKETDEFLKKIKENIDKMRNIKIEIQQKKYQINQLNNSLIVNQIFNMQNPCHHN